MTSELRDDVRGLSPIVLQQYLRSRGWAPTEAHAALVTYQREGVSLDVPMIPEYADYPRRVAEAITVLAGVGGATDGPAAAAAAAGGAAAEEDEEEEGPAAAAAAAPAGRPPLLAASARAARLCRLRSHSSARDGRPPSPRARPTTGA